MISLDRLKKCLIIKCIKMKLESLKLQNFLDAKMDNEQMSVLNGGLYGSAGNTVTPAGSGCGPGLNLSNPTAVYHIDYGYDVIRTNSDGTTYTTYHDRSNMYEINPANCIGL